MSNLPPGVTNRMIDEAAGVDARCEICGLHVDICICPECPICHEHGNPYCYDEGHLTRTQEQIISRAKADVYEMRNRFMEVSWRFEQLSPPGTPSLFKVVPLDTADGVSPKAISPTADQDTIEAMIDKLSLKGVLEMMAEVVFAKAEHIAVNWQDTMLAKRWCDFGDRIAKLANEVDL